MRQRVFILWLKSSWSKLNSKIEIRGNNPQSLEKLQNPVNPTKKTTGNIGVGSFFSTCWFDAIVKTHDFVILKKSSPVFMCFFSRIPATEWGGCTVDVVKAKKHLSTKISTKNQGDRTSCHFDLCHLIMVCSILFWLFGVASSLTFFFWCSHFGSLFLWSTSMFGVLLLVCLSSLLQIFFCLVCSYRYHVSFQITNLRLRKPTHRIHVLYGISNYIYHRF